jgi:predicted HicB family RNase H-like nuclease
MAVTKAQQKAVAKYMQANYDEIKVRVPKGEKERIKLYAESTGESVNGFICAAIRERMQRYGAAD